MLKRKVERLAEIVWSAKGESVLATLPLETVQTPVEVVEGYLVDRVLPAVVFPERICHTDCDLTIKVTRDANSLWVELSCEDAAILFRGHVLRICERISENGWRTTRLVKTYRVTDDHVWYNALDIRQGEIKLFFGEMKPKPGIYWIGS